MSANMAWCLMRADEACDLTEPEWADYDAVYKKLPLGTFHADVKDFKGNKQATKFKLTMENVMVSDADRMQLLQEKEDRRQAEFEKAKEINVN